MPLPSGDTAPSTAPVIAPTPVLGRVAVYAMPVVRSVVATGAFPARAAATNAAMAAMLETEGISNEVGCD